MTAHPERGHGLFFIGAWLIPWLMCLKNIELSKGRSTVDIIAERDGRFFVDESGMVRIA